MPDQQFHQTGRSAYFSNDV